MIGTGNADSAGLLNKYKPSNSNELDFVKLSSATLGTTLMQRNFQLTSQISWPMEQFSTEAPEHEYTVNAVVLLSY